MKVSRDSLTLGTINYLVDKGYVVEVEADNEWAEIYKASLEEQPIFEDQPNAVG